MPKAPATPGKLGAMIMFALSCFGLLLFLWLSFGGATPLKPRGYRVTIAFPDATQLAEQADVRISGVHVGKVVELAKVPERNRTVATLQLDSGFTPLPSDTRAILRQKTLLGETFVELTPGTRAAPGVPEDGALPDGRVARTVEFDEILDTFDPRTRRDFQTWQQDTGAAIGDRGSDLNGAFGQLPAFIANGSDLVGELRRDRVALGILVRDGGEVLAALTERENQLQRLVRATDELFDETARRDTALAETVRLLPAFLRESQRSFRRTQRFAATSRPVVRLLRQPTRDLAPTLRDLAAAAPDLQRAFRGIERLEPVSRRGLPALAETLRALRPAFEQLGPFLSQVNPTLELLGQNPYLVGDFFTTGASALADTLPTATSGSPGHYLRQFGVTGLESVGVWGSRLPDNRGNSYPQGNQLADPRVARLGIGPQWDCRPSGGEREASEIDRDGATQNHPACWVASARRLGNKTWKYPHAEAADYSKDTAAAKGRP